MIYARDGRSTPRANAFRLVNGKLLTFRDSDARETELSGGP
jgi:hypothetical protein